MSQLVLLASTAPAQVQQDYLLQARQMQALSFAVHIPLVCFGIAVLLILLGMPWPGMAVGRPLIRV